MPVEPIVNLTDKEIAELGLTPQELRNLVIDPDLFDHDNPRDADVGLAIQSAVAAIRKYQTLLSEPPKLGKVNDMVEAVLKRRGVPISRDGVLTARAAALSLMEMGYVELSTDFKLTLVPVHGSPSP